MPSGAREYVFQPTKGDRMDPVSTESGEDQPASPTGAEASQGA